MPRNHYSPSDRTGLVVTVTMIFIAAAGVLTVFYQPLMALFSDH